MGLPILSGSCVLVVSLALKAAPRDFNPPIFVYVSRVVDIGLRLFVSRLDESGLRLCVSLVDELGVRSGGVSVQLSSEERRTNDERIGLESGLDRRERVGVERKLDWEGGGVENGLD